MARKKDRKAGKKPGTKRSSRGPSSGKSRKAASKKKGARRKAPAKKAAAKKAATKKAATKKAATKKAATRTRRKAAPSRKKPARKKTVAKKTATTKTAAARKTAGKSRRGERGAEFFDHFRERLLSDRQQITRRLDELREELRGLEEAPPRELEEWAQEEKDRDILIRLEERETDELRRIQAALGLIDNREYGNCQVCGRPIPRARLEELPTAFRCIEHTP